MQYGQNQREHNNYHYTQDAECAHHTVSLAVFAVPLPV